MRRLLYVVFLIASAQSLAQGVTLDAQQSYSIANQCMFAVDENQSTDFNSVNQLELSHFPDQKVSLGFLEAPLWIKCQLQNISNNPKWYVSVDLPQVTHFDITTFVEGYQLNQARTGMYVPFKQKPIKDFIPVVELELPKDANIVMWMRLESIIPLNFELEVQPESTYFSQLTTRYIINSFYFGVILALLFYNLFLFFSIKDKSFLYYSSYLFCTSMYALMLTGLSQQILFPENPKVELIFVVFAAVGSLLFSLLFALRFLRLGQYRGQFKWISNINFAVLAIALVIGLFGDFTIYALLLSTFSMFVFLYIIVLAFISWVTLRYAPAKFFLLAWGTLLIGIVIHSLEFNSLIASNIFTQYIIHIAMILEAVLLSYALGERFSLLKQEKEQSQKQSARILNEANIKLRHALNLSEEANAAKSQLVSLISHELRTPIHIALASINALKEKQTTEQREDVLNTQLAVSHLSHHVENLITSAEILNQALKPKYETVDIQQLVTQWQAYVNQYKSFEVLAKFSISQDDEVKCCIDAELVNKIALNILDNACKFTKRGLIEVNITVESDVVHIDVEDTGSGISEEKLEVIKQGFTQASNGMSRDSQGLGLGLTLSMHLTNLLKGTLDIRMTDKNHTRVSIEIPNNTVVEQTKTIEHKVSPFVHEKLLIVEDNKVNAMVLSKMLKHLSCQIDLAENGQVALDKLKTNEYDLIFMDLQMPVMDGISATIAIRQQYQRHIPIIAVTANASQQDQERCNDAGMDDFISKPVNKEKLEAAIRRWYRIPGKD